MYFYTDAIILIYKNSPCIVFAYYFLEVDLGYYCKKYARIRVFTDPFTLLEYSVSLIEDSVVVREKW